MIGKTNANSGGGGKIVRDTISLTSNQDDQSDLIGTKITITYNNDTESGSFNEFWDGVPIPVDVPFGIPYTVTFGNIANYATPSPISATAIEGSPNTITGKYLTELVKVNVTQTNEVPHNYEITIAKCNIYGGKYVETEWLDTGDDYHSMWEGLVYINTGVNSSYNTRVVLNAQLCFEKYHNYYGYNNFTCNYIHDKKGYYREFIWRSSGGYNSELIFESRYASGGSNYYKRTAISPQLGIYTIDKNGKTTTITAPNGFVITHTLSPNSVNYTSSPIYLGGGVNDNNTPLQKGRMKIYSCKIYDKNGTLLREFIPVKQIGTATIGLYDKVSGVFYSTQGGTGGSVGPVKIADTIAIQTTAQGIYKVAYNEHYIIKPNVVSNYKVPALSISTANSDTKTYDITGYQEYINGVYIYDGKNDLLVDPSSWNTANNSNAEGVALITDEAKFIICKTSNASKSFYNSYNSFNALYSCRTDLGVSVCSDQNSAKSYYNGLSDSIMYNKLYVHEEYEDAPDNIFTVAMSKKGAHSGKRGYLGSAGEWNLVNLNITAINNAMTLIGGESINTGRIYLTSTLQSLRQGTYDVYDSEGNYIDMVDCPLADAWGIYNSALRSTNIVSVSEVIDWVVDAYMPTRYSYSLFKLED